MTINTKTTHGTKLLKATDAAEGVVRVAFAQLNVIDHDRDVTEPGAFQVGQKCKVCQTGHAHGVRVAGAGEIIGEEQIGDGVWAIAELKFFLNTEAGREEYETIKALDELGHTQEFSYGYDILAAQPGQVDGKNVQVLKSLSVYEISPVLRGAGIGTHQLAVKGRKDWSTNVVWRAWDALHPWREGETNSYVTDVLVDPTTVIVQDGDDLKRVPYTVTDDGSVTFDEAASQRVRTVYEDITEPGDDADEKSIDTSADVKGHAVALALQFESIKAQRRTAQHIR